MTTAQSTHADQSAPILAFHDVTIRYGAIDAVQNVNLSVGAGDFVCLIGANGSGKSSLLKAALGLVPLSKGRIEYGVARERVSYMPQIATAGTDFPATAREIVLSGVQRHGVGFPFYRPEDKRAAERAIKLFSIEPIADRRFSALSGGQRQRVLLARAMCKDPALLLLDEPDNALDPDTTSQLMSLLEQLNHEHGVAVLMVSHDMERATCAAQKIAVLNHQLTFYGTVAAWRRGIA